MKNLESRAFRIKLSNDRMMFLFEQLGHEDDNVEVISMKMNVMEEETA